MTSALTPGPARLLVVCTGNVCRSPIAQGLLLAAFGDDRPDLDVASAGTGALVGHRMDRAAERELGRRGARLPGFRARQLTTADVVQADLVLTATREHRAAVVTLDPSAVRRVFTLGELDRLLGDQPYPSSPVTPVDLAAIAAGRRGRGAPARRDEDDLDDPFGRGGAAFERCAARVERLLARPVRWLTGSVWPAG